MDRIPGAGGPPGGGVDGAFERFLTAALATIITIMFSWRLLAEEEEATGRGEVGSGPKTAQMQYRTLMSGQPGFEPPKQAPRTLITPSVSDIESSDTEDSRSRSLSRSSDTNVFEDIISERFESQLNASLSAAAPDVATLSIDNVETSDDDAGNETLTTWDQYKWEEELGQEEHNVIKTRRSIRDFKRSSDVILQSPPKSLQDKSDSESIDAVANANNEDQNENSKSPVVPFSQRFANFEYKDTGGDSGYVDLYPDSDSSASSDDECVYEIQVSDSDSESGDEQSGSFFGVTTLDTIMEEYESDISDFCEHGGGGHSKSVEKGGDNDCQREDCVQIPCAIPKTELSNSNPNAPVGMPEVNDQNTILSSQRNDIVVKLSKLDGQKDNICKLEQNVAVKGVSQAENVEYNLSPDIAYQVESLPTHQQLGSETLQECDLTVNNTSLLNKDRLSFGENDKCKVTRGELNDSQAQKSNLTLSHSAQGPVSRESGHKVNLETNDLRLPLSGGTGGVSDISDGSTPSTPIRTCALDNPDLENFSDTESCSSESVITVLSVRSTDSDNYTDRYDVTANDPSGQRHSLAGGHTDQSLNINDLTNDGSGSYENNSLVSGFLNDSLNSLLSENNGDTDTASEHEYDESIVDLDEAKNLKSTQNENIGDGLTCSITSEQDNKSNYEINDIIHTEEQTPTYTVRQNESQLLDKQYDKTGQDANDQETFLKSEDQISFQNEFISEMSDELSEQRICSDNSSDSSDPPLREYDPDDDDLAAFQFDQDSDCDNDSFYLLVGNEGSLRNFETFTNLNSLELSPEYGDAVTSRITDDDARGFTFSYTEQINTDFKKRSYFTDRNMSSDSDARSDEPLSPITSEDEEIVAAENDKNEKYSSQANQNPLQTLSPYSDADLSNPNTESSINSDQIDAKRIDFQKYIIHSEMSPQSESLLVSNKISSQSGHKDSAVIDTDSGATVYGIDCTGVRTDSWGASDINNKLHQGQQVETFSSLTEKIRSLSVQSDTSGSSENETDKPCTADSHSGDSESSKNESDISYNSEQTKNPQPDRVNEDNTLSSSDYKSQVSRETNIDAISLENAPRDSETVLLEFKCSTNRSTNNDITSDTSSVQANGDQISIPDYKVVTSASKIETNIDDIFEKEADVNSKAVCKPSHISVHSTPPTRETNIDDIFDETDHRINESQPVCSKVETNIDDIFDDDTISDKRLSYETFVDDLFQPEVLSTNCTVPSVQTDFTSESAIETQTSYRDIPNTFHTESDNDLSSQSPIHYNDKESTQQISDIALTQSEPAYISIENNYTPKDNSSDIVDKISNKPHTENSSELSIEKYDNKTKSEVFKPTHAGPHSLLSHIETDIDKDLGKCTNDNYKPLTKQQHFSNDTNNNNSEFGLHPVKNNGDNYTQDYSPLTHTIPSGKSHDNTVDSSDLRPELSASDIELKITEDDELSEKSETDQSDYQDSYSSYGSSSYVSEDESFHSVDENLLYQYSKLRARGLSESAISRVVRSPLTKPSDLFSKSKDLGHGVKRRIRKHHLKKYSSILQQPITPERSQSPVANTPDRPPSDTRLKVLQSRQRFLSAENLSGPSFEDKFLQHRTSLVSSTPRKYLKRHERNLAESTESLPTDMSNMSMLNRSYDSYSGIDRLHSLPLSRNILELYASRNSSANSSFDKPDHHKLHANCIFSPEKREQIQHTTESLENMFEQLLRYGSISSLAETDLDADSASQTSSLQDNTDLSQYVSFQYPLERAVSMSAIAGSSDGRRLPRKPNTRRFAKRNVQKSKSLQTLETNLDEVFDDEMELSGTLKKVPSVHELRVSKSLSKLNVPDWFSRSTFSRSDSTQSLFTYAGRLGSTSTLGSSVYPPSIPSSPAPTPGSQTVIITKRVTPTSSSPGAKLLRAPALPTTPERAPIHPTGASLPSDRFRKVDKNLKPIAIVPFAKLRQMFEQKSLDEKKKTVSPLTSPTKEKPKVRFESMPPTRDSYVAPAPKSKETDIDSNIEPVQNRSDSMSPPPPLPERKPILTNAARQHESAAHPNAQPKRAQVHFSDEQNVSKSQEPNSNIVQQNGTSSKPKSSIKKGFRASLPLPQFRFRRPGAFATKAATSPPVESQTQTQSKKGKINCSSSSPARIDIYACDNCTLVSCPPWLHALELNAKTDGETLFEFLQKRRYSSILENGFAEQLDELQDRDLRFNFPVLALGKHSNGLSPMDGPPDLRVVLTDAYNHRTQNDFLNNKLRGDSSVDDILDSLLLLDGYRTGRMRLDENGRIVPRTSGDDPYSPDTPPGLTLSHTSAMCASSHDVLCAENETDVDYVLVKCEFPQCHRETNLKEARKCYKTCHSCYTYYCSRVCRKNDWQAHKRVCIYSRINSACKHVIKAINRLPYLQYQCSRIARRGYLAQGRGCVIFAFPDISSAEDFLQYGVDSLWVPPVYITLKDLANAQMFGSKLDIITETCQQYNPELKYVIHVAIVIPPQLPVKPIPRRMDGIIQKCAKLRLSPAHMHPKQESDEIPSTLILTAVPGNQHSDEQDSRKTRELCFINIQRKLRNRGISLRHQFPDVYNRLIDFVADAKHFSPLIIYPTDGRTCRKFMCVIMPEAEPEIEWISDPDLFHELDVFEDEEEISTPNLSLCHQTRDEIML